MSHTQTETNTNKKIFLIKVEPGENNNKFYNLTDLGDGTFLVEYGRVGGHVTQHTYPISDWNHKYHEKCPGHGYEDITHLHKEEEKNEEVLTEEKKSSFTQITNKIIAKLVENLRNYAHVSVEQNYTISSDNVTQAMVNEAQHIVDEITHLIKPEAPTEKINKLMVDLFKVVPRRMAHVNDYLFQMKTIKTKDDLNLAHQIIHSEQNTLDVMAGQVSTHSKTQEHKAKANLGDILDAMGIDIEETPKEDYPGIMKLMGDDQKHFRRAYMVTNRKTQKRFDTYLDTVDNKKIELFWHGSRNENWWSILDKGWMLRSANAVISGKMFGYGIYWANKFHKSLNYTSYHNSYYAHGNSDIAYLSLALVHVGNQLKLKKHESWCSELDFKRLKEKGNYDSLYAQGGADLINDEFIVYTEPQCTVKYLVEIN